MYANSNAVALTITLKYNYNGSQLKNRDISGAIFTLSLSILILNFHCVEGARDVRLIKLTPIICVRIADLGLGMESDRGWVGAKPLIFNRLK